MIYVQIKKLLNHILTRWPTLQPSSSSPHMPLHGPLDMAKKVEEVRNVIKAVVSAGRRICHSSYQHVFFTNVRPDVNMRNR